MVTTGVAVTIAKVQRQFSGFYKPGSERSRGPLGRKWLLSLAVLPCVLIGSPNAVGESGEQAQINNAKDVGPGSQVVASSKTGSSLSADGFEAILRMLRAEHPGRYQTPEEIEVLVRQILTTEALADYARERSFDEEPTIRWRINRLLRDEIVKSEVDEKWRLADITDEDVAAWYETHRNEYVIPETLSVHSIFLAKTDAAESDRGDTAALARDVATQVDAEGSDLREFQNLVKRYSEDPHRAARGGFLGFFQGETLDGEPLTESQQALRDAARAIPQVGGVSGPVETFEGIYILRLSGRRAEHVRTLDEVREETRYLLYKQRRAEALEQLMEEVLPSGSIEMSSLDEFISRPLPSEGGTSSQPPFPPLPGMPSEPGQTAPAVGATDPDETEK